MSNKGKLYASCAALGLAAAVVAVAGAAEAQTTATGSSTAGAAGAAESTTPVSTAQSGNTLPTLEITARRVEENEQTVPVTVTAVTGPQLQALNVQRFNDLQFIDPALKVSGTGVGGQGAEAQFSIRGISEALNTPAVVQSYLNEVPVTNIGLQYELYDLQDVQVLEGPQGVSFGKNSTGGAVLFNTQRPTNDYDAWLEGSYGNYDFYQVTGMVNLPIVQDKLLARITVDGQWRNGIISNPIGPGEENRDHYSVRGSLSWKPTDRFSNDLVVDYFHSNEQNTDGAGGGAGGNQVLQVTLPAAGSCAPTTNFGAANINLGFPNAALNSSLYNFSLPGSILGLPAGSHVGNEQYCFLSHVDAAGNPITTIPETPAQLATYGQLLYFQGTGQPGSGPSTPFGDLAYQNALMQQEGVRESPMSPSHFEPATAYGLSLKSQYDFGETPVGALVAKNIFGYRYSTVFANTIFGPPVYVGLGGGSGGPITENSYTEEFQLAGDVDKGDFQWLAGIFYQHDQQTNFNESIPNLSVPTIPQADINFLYDVTGGVISQGFNLSKENYVGDSVAGYVRGIYRIFSSFDVPDWIKNTHITAGYRYTHDNDSATAFTPGMRFVTGDVQSGPLFVPGQVTPRQAASCGYVTPGGVVLVTPAALASAPLDLADCSRSAAASWGASGWEFGLDDQITDHVLVYVKDSRGYKAGGFNNFSTTGLFVYNPEFITSLEAGLKADWNVAGTPLRTNFTYYHETYSNIQTNFLAQNPISGAFETSIVNENQATVEGYEAQVQWIPVHGLTLSGSYAYADNFYSNFIDAELAAAGAPTPPSASFGCGKTPILVTATSIEFQCAKVPFTGVAPNTYAIAGDYHLPIPEAWGRMILHADYFYQTGSTAPNLATGGNSVTQPGYGNLDATFSWERVMNSHIDVSLWCRNLLNTEAATINNSLTTSVFSSITKNFALEPRLYGITLKYHMH